VTLTVFGPNGWGRNTGTVTAGSETSIDVMLGTLDEPQIVLPPDFILADNGGVYIDFGGGFDVLSLVATNAKDFPTLYRGETELSGRQYVLGPVRSSGLLHTRKIYSPPGTSYLRYLEIFENPYDFDANLRFNLRGSASTQYTASGDDVLDPDERYFVDDFLDVAVVFAGSEGTYLAPDNATPNYNIEWRNVTVPAGGRVMILHFIVVEPDPAEAEAQADTLMRLADPTAFSDLSAEERSQIVNFEVPQP
jgi:hypothetical protein